MKRIYGFVLLILLTSMFSGSALAADDTVENAPLQGLDRVETVVYGAPLTGGLFLRLAKVERDLFGMELPGSLTERQQALQNFVELGNSAQPSLIFKIGVAEWVTLRKVNPSTPLATRVSNLERTLENETQEGALSARLERILAKLLPGGIGTTQVQLPAATVFKARFVHTLTVRNVQKGDLVELELLEDCIIDATLAVAKGNRVFARVTKVKMPRSFGRPSEISVEFEHVESIGGALTPVLIGPEAKRAMEVDSATLGAVGTSFLGAVLVGPVGLAGGFLIRGNDKQIPEGTLVYVETSEFADVAGYQVPSVLSDSLGGDTAVSGASDTQAPPPSDTVTY